MAKTNRQILECVRRIEAMVERLLDEPPPEPEPEDKPPLPNESSLVAALAATYPLVFADSCGDWEFMDLLVDALRENDTRWGYNGKRGNVHDPSPDCVAYHWGSGPREGSTEVYIVDVIMGHCGLDPRPAWIDQTQATADAGTIGRWTGRGRF